MGGSKSYDLAIVCCSVTMNSSSFEEAVQFAIEKAMSLVIIFMIINIIIYPQEMTFTSIIEFLEKDPTRLRRAQCADLQSVCTKLSFPSSLAPPPESLGTRLA